MNKKNEKIKSLPYNAGIDFLRIFAMFMIVVTHVLGKGGIRSTVKENFDLYYFVTWGIQVSAYSAVNCYALISGYVGVDSPYRYSKCLSLWLQVFFYTLLFILFFTFLQKPITYHDWIQAFFPIITGQYWYVTAYFGLLIFMPILNLALRKLNTKDLKHIVLLAIIFFSVLPALLNTKVDEFSFAKGFSMNWLSVLYIIGAYLKRLDLKRLFSRKFLLFLCLMAMAVTIFIFFVTLDIKKTGRLFRIIKRMAPATLGVYLFHLNPLLVKFLLKDGFESFVTAPIWLFPFLILGTALLIYLVSTLVELLRIKLFTYLKVRHLILKLDTYLPFDN